ncbi:M16 family metallopeptidase [Oceanibium sediminis]|uniref:M16 family metallopeptidase n=1 Tax=Oceanibium sediminis TaxID=2026339 RepID=UPI000DD44927|nr:pitrilysin family protein [Oceanibium sediminis]
MIRLLCILFVFLAASLPARAATDVVEVTSPGGITAWLVQERGIPMLALSMEFTGGAMMEPDEKLGATTLMMGLLEGGAGALDALGFATRAEELAVRLGFSAGRSEVSVSATMLTENRAESLALLRSALIEPRFDAEALERVRGQFLASLRMDETDPGAQARHAFAAAAYGDHPFGRPTDGTVETVAALTRQDLLDAHARAFARDRVFIGVVGDISAEELGPLLDELLGDLPATGPALPEPAEVIDEGETIVIPMPAPQSLARFGHSGIHRDDPDFIPAYVFNQIFGGGGFPSRLSEEVREKRGLTYGISTGLASDPFGALFLGSVTSANETIAEALEVTRAEWARAREQGVTEEELAEVKQFLTGAYPLRFDGNARIASILRGFQAAGLPKSYIAERNAMIESVTLEDVNRAARRLLKPEKLRVVVVGQPEGMGD